jgi:Domain of unknown function (DUF4349)
MRPREDELIDPEIAEQLDAIEATLAGEPVAPRFAELAELALLLSAARPEAPRPEFAAELDRRVEGRFGRARAGAASADGVAGASAGAWAGRAGSARARSRWWGSWSLTPVLGTAAAAAVAIVVVVVSLSGGTGATTFTGTNAVASKASATTTATATKDSSAARGLAPATTPSPAAAGGGTTKHALSFANGQTLHGHAGGGSKAPATSRAPAASPPARPVINGALTPVVPNQPATTPGASAPETVSPAPLPNGRKIIQSSILQLGARGSRIDAVAQGVFNVVGAVNGIVDSSNVSSTGEAGASAQFQLRVPSSLLSVALTDLSRLRYAHVISRTDNTQDVNSPYLSVQRGVALAQATLTRLRTRLAAATLESQIAGLRAQIAGEKASLARAQASLHGLSRQISYSRLEVSILATTGGSTGGGGGGFGVHKAGHDALRVLEVTAGVALIVLAVLVPVGLVAALAWWLAAAIQRRRRERALDMA